MASRETLYRKAHSVVLYNWVPMMIYRPVSFTAEDAEKGICGDRVTVWV